MPLTTPTSDAHSTTHATFTIERHFAAPPARVFRAFADPEAKRRWFGGEADRWTPELREMDFRAGGAERARGRWHTGVVSDFRAVYHDIIADDRIVYVYDMYVNDRKLSVSLATIQLHRDGAGTRMVLTEQGVFFDGLDAASSREAGTKFLMDALERSLAE